MIRVLSHRWNHLTRRWDHWAERRGGAHDATPTWLLCFAGFGLGVTAMGLGEVILVLSS